MPGMTGVHISLYHSLLSSFPFLPSFCRLFFPFPASFLSDQWAKCYIDVCEILWGFYQTEISTWTHGLASSPPIILHHMLMDIGHMVMDPSSSSSWSLKEWQGPKNVPTFLLQVFLVVYYVIVYRDKKYNEYIYWNISSGGCIGVAEVAFATGPPVCLVRRSGKGGWDRALRSSAEL